MSTLNTANLGGATHSEPGNADHTISTTQQSDDPRKDSPEIEETTIDVEPTTVAAQDELQLSKNVDGANYDSASMKRPEKSSTTSHTSDWVPRCPYCDAANEYGYLMCDAVLPGLCQGGDNSGRGVEESEGDDSGRSDEECDGGEERDWDVVLYEVFSTFA